MTSGPRTAEFDPGRLACRALGAGASLREAQLYARYLRALALLCECAPYVDEPDFVAVIDALLDDAHRAYPLDVRRDGRTRELALREGPDV